jgi:L-amino acid N-acyltransferase YncA
MPYEFFGMLMQLANGCPFYVAETDGKIAGYGLLRPHVPFDTFHRAAELTCFLAPENTGRGIGTAILGRLADDARSLGIDTILASVSSENEGSIGFHKKCGFAGCGRFIRAGNKFGKDFDEVWLQLFVRP